MKNNIAKFALVSFGFACLLLISIVHDRFPKTSGDPSLLYPSSSNSLQLLKFKEQKFGTAQHDLISYKINNNHDQSWDLEELEADLSNLKGIESISMPGNKKRDHHLRLISENKKFKRLILKIDSNLSEKQQVKLNSQIHSIILKYKGLDLKRTGVFFITRTVTESIDQEIQKIIPIVIGVLVLTLFLCLKNIKEVVLIIFSNLIALGTTFLAYGIIGFKVGPIAQLAPPFLLAVGGSFNLHVAMRLKKSDPKNFNETRKELTQGVSVAAATTILSLLSLIFLDVKGVTDFAIFAAFGTFLSAAYSLYLIPDQIKSKLDNKSWKLNQDKLKYRLSLGRKYGLAIITILVLILASGLNSLHIHTDPVRFIPKSSKELKQILLNEKRFSGGHFLSILLIGKNVSSELNSSELQTSLKQIKQLPGVFNLISYLSFESLNESEKQLLNQLSVNDTNIPSDLYNPEINSYQIIVETDYEGADLLKLKENIYQILLKNNSLNTNFSIGLTSMELVMAEQTAYIVNGLLQSLITSLITVFFLAWLIFKNLKIAIIAIIPNIIPLIFVFGFIGYTIGELDFGSCLVASVALGIAVDNTFHFLLCWRKNKSVLATIQETAEAFIITTAVLFLTFISMSLAQVMPVASFGLYLSITLLTGVMADLYVLPCLLTFIEDQN